MRLAAGLLASFVLTGCVTIPVLTALEENRATVPSGLPRARLDEEASELVLTYVQGPLACAGVSPSGASGWNARATRGEVTRYLSALMADNAGGPAEPARYRLVVQLDGSFGVDAKARLDLEIGGRRWSTTASASAGIGDAVSGNTRVGVAVGRAVRLALDELAKQTRPDRLADRRSTP